MPDARLVPGATCPGALEALLAAIARAFDQVPVGGIVSAWNAVSLAAAIAAAGLLIWHVTRRPVAVLATLSAIVVTHGVSGALAPAGSASIAAAAVALFVVLRPAVGGDAAGLRDEIPLRRDVPTRSRGGLVLSGALISSAAIAPSLTVPLALAAGVLLRHHQTALSPRPTWLGALAGASAVGVAGLLSQGLAGGWRPVGAEPCLIPSLSTFSLQAVVAAIAEVSAGIGPAVWGFALLGLAGRAIGLRGAISVRGSAAPLAVIAALPFLAVSWPGPDAGRALALPLVLLWSLTALGMGTLLSAYTGAAGRLAALVFVAAVPVLQYAHLPAPILDAMDEPRGHTELTSTDVAAMASAMPPGATVVVEDALTDLLWLGLPNTKRISRVPLDSAAVGAALERGPVFALPRGTRGLELRGFRMEPTGRTGAAGLSRVAGPSPCLTPDETWRPAPMVSDATGLAIVAGRESARGPVIVYLASTASAAVEASDWPLAARRGFFVQQFDLSSADGRAQYEEAWRQDAVPADWPGHASAFVARLEAWRVPGAPSALPVDVRGASISAAVVRRHPESIGAAPTMCPTFVGPIESFGPRQGPL